MIHNTDDDNILSKQSMTRMRLAARELCLPNANLEEFYIKYNLYKKQNEAMISRLMNKHVINWMFTIRCEIGRGGMYFIQTILLAILKTMKRDIDEIQFEYCKGVFDIFWELHNLYKCK